ncbi:MAG: hypothetical protein AAF298_02170 [Cyanobacteria bacterium P01_A01_bin.40]
MQFFSNGEKLRLRSEERAEGLIFWELGKTERSAEKDDTHC